VISVILCSHNSRPDYLAETIGGLRSQQLPISEWELIVMDNASDAPIAENLDLSWHPAARCVREEKLGLTLARVRGINESHGELLVFVDDDNVLDPDYLEIVHRIAGDYPFLGAWGGQSSARFDVEPPEWTRRLWGSLVIRELSRDSWSNMYHLHDTLPAGAGLCVRRSAAGRYVKLHENGERDVLLDRAGRELLSGGDTDLVCCSMDLGLGSGTFADLKLAHLIPASRLSESYLLALVEGIAYSAVILRSFRPWAYPHLPDRGIVGKLADLARVLRMGRRERMIQGAARRGSQRAERDLSRRQRGS